MIALLDYGSGNLRSVHKSLIKVGADVRLVQRPDEIGDAPELIRTPRVAVRDDDAVVHSDRMHDPLKPNGADDGRPAVDESHWARIASASPVSAERRRP